MDLDLNLDLDLSLTLLQVSLQMVLKVLDLDSFYEAPGLAVSAGFRMELVFRTDTLSPDYEFT